MSFKNNFSSFLRRWADSIDSGTSSNPAPNAQNANHDEAVLMRSMLSHNVRMPLSIISGYSNLLLNNVITEEDKKRECIGKICGNVKYLSNVLSLIIDGNERTGFNYDFKPINLVECVRETAGYVQETAKRFSLKVQVNCSIDEVVINGDYTQIMRVIFNLFENSVKYMQRPGNIVITIDEPEPGHVMMIYKDDGKGMPANETEHIFESGYRGSTSEYGTGMGMYYVHQVITDHNGTVKAVSDIDKGMCIYMNFTTCENHP